MKKYIYMVTICTLIVLNGCKKPYNPQAISAPNNYLVIEGVINSGSDSTIIKLSRTVNVLNSNTVSPELHALLTVESDQDNVYPLIETTNGRYTSPGLNLDNSRKYRLRIKTQTNKEYLSDFVQVVNSPAIDTISYAIQSNGVSIYSNTHDPNNATRYYRWDYQETWEFHSDFFSQFKSNGDTVLYRDLVNDNIYQCWGNQASSTIILGSSAKLIKDVIVNNPITFVPSGSEKFTSRYSILVRQYALTGEAYNFWQNLKKNTEELGSIFDAQPSQLKGNIHSTTDSREPVIGYISVGSISSQRIYINVQQLPAWLPVKAYVGCKLDTFLFKYVAPGSTTVVNQENQFFNYNKGAYSPLIPVSSVARPAGPTIGHSGSTPECVDCTIRGTNKKPTFWKE